MSTWVRNNRRAFERDVLQYFCQASQQLYEQFARFSDSKTISFPVVRAMVGEPLNKGLLWRLKDKAHHVFLDEEFTTPEGLLLDWTLGYIFHESLKLMEDAHQRQYYAPQLSCLSYDACTPGLVELLTELLAIQKQTAESMRREVVRLQDLLRHARRLFGIYFRGASDHRLLARFLHDNPALVQATFQDDYPRFLSEVYGELPERMHFEAALSLLESARSSEAVAAVEAALRLNPDCGEALALKQTLESQPGQGAVSQ